MSSPSTTAWMNCVMRSSSGGRGCAPGGPCEHGPPGGTSLPGGLGDHRVGRGGVLRSDDLHGPVLPLSEEELLGRRTRLVPGQRTEDALHLVLVQVVGQLVLVQ